MYKVCWAKSGCADMDILAGFDAAIHDGVDIISISIGGPIADYSSDSISVGSFHAVRKGILTVASAGNDGPSSGTVTNHEPWILTVAASGIDRTFKSQIDLGNGKSFSGMGISMFNPKAKSYPLVSGVDAAKDTDDEYLARYCFSDSLDRKKVKGKVMVCRMGASGVESTVKSYGGAGAIVVSDQYLDNAQIFMAPATSVNTSIGDSIYRYINSTRSPSAVIQKTREVRIPAPFVASFSSRGPNPGSIRLLKPDIAAPGIDILAAFTLKRSLTGLDGDTQFSKFTIMSGTSMACPHAAGVAAYVKSFHPDWTPAAIKSAIITSAKPISRRVNKDAEFAYGGDQVNPRRAASPGLIYDMEDLSYVQFLCAEGYNATTLAPLVGSRSVNCSSIVPGLGHDSLNYPTIQLTLKPAKTSTMAVFRRRVTNVGPPSSVYNVTVRAPKGVEITVEPQSFSFSKAIAKIRRRETCDPLCMILYTCFDGSSEIASELCSNEGMNIMAEIVRTSSSVGSVEDYWLKLLVSRICVEGHCFPDLFSKLYKAGNETFTPEHAFLLRMVSDIVNERLKEVSIPMDATHFILGLFKQAVQAFDFVSGERSELPTGSTIIDVMGYSLVIIRDNCAGGSLEELKKDNKDSSDTVELLLSSGLIELLLDLLRKLELPTTIKKALNQSPSSSSSSSKPCPYRGFRRDIVSVIGNCVYRRKAVQDKIRERDGLFLMLQQSVIDDENPFLREWGLWCIRNLLEENQENQKAVAELEMQGSVNVPQLREIGLKVEIDPITSRPKLVNDT